MKLISEEEILQMTRFYRANLINCVSGLKPVNLIGTISNEGLNNLAIFSSVVHLGANPALLAFVQRPLTDTSHTYKNIVANQFYTINHVHSAILEKAHFTAAKFGDGVSEFEKCELTPVFKNNFKAPFVKESHIQLGMELVEVVPIHHNNTKLVIGKIKAIHIDEAFLEDDGNINLEKSDSITVAGLETYYSSSQKAQLSYAKLDANHNIIRNES